MDKNEVKEKQKENHPAHCVFALETPIQPQEANHSFSGIIFDIKNKSKLSRLRLLSVSVGGDLGDMTVWVCDGPAQATQLDMDEWNCVAKGTFPPSIEKTTEINITEKVELAQDATMGLYIHSAMHTDTGLNYQSFRRMGEVVCEDANLQVLAGMGHTSPIPFDREAGWFRPTRGPAGAIKYLEIPTIWSLESHSDFPVEFRAAVRVLLVCHAFGAKRGRRSHLPKIPTDLLYHILEFADYDWFNPKPKPKSKPKALTSTSAAGAGGGGAGANANRGRNWGARRFPGLFMDLDYEDF